jgi:tetratricopeptide (TPR) repeat protein
VACLAAGAVACAAQKTEKISPSPAPPTAFAPMAETNDLAAVWNSPEFAKRLLGSYGFASDAEPRLSPEEQAVYRDKIVPALRDDPKKAIEVLRPLVKPGASAVFDFTLGNLCFQTEDLTNAVVHFEAAIAKFPDYRRAHKNLGFALVRDGKLDAAVQPLLTTVRMGAGDGKVFGLLGYIYLSQKRNVSAEAAYRQALVFEPENLEFRLGLVKSAVASADYDYALALLEELLRQHPERESLWTLQANVFIQREQPARAAVSLEMLRRLAAATPAMLYLLGDLYLAQESRDLALAAYLEAIEKDGGRNPAKAIRAAQILISRGGMAEAQPILKRIRQDASGLMPGDEQKLLKLEARVALAGGATEAGIQALEQLIQRDPLDGETLLLAGDYYARHGQAEKAELRFKMAANIQGFEADASVKQAQLLVQGQKYPQAVDLLRKAQKAKPRENVQRYLERVEQLARNASRS